MPFFFGAASFLPVPVSWGFRVEGDQSRSASPALGRTGRNRLQTNSSDFSNNHSREVGECPQEACSCRDCGHIRIGRGRDNRAPTHAAACQGRPPEPLPSDESRLQSRRDQVGTQPGRRGCPQLLRHPVTSSISPNRRCRHLGAGRRGRASHDEDRTRESRDVAARIRLYNRVPRAVSSFGSRDCSRRCAIQETI